MSNDNWKMPEPIFQRTSGSLPADFASRIANYSASQAADAGPADADSQSNLSTLYAPPDEIVQDAADPPPAMVAAPAIEEQPYISEQFSTPGMDTAAPAVSMKKRGVSRPLLISVVLFVLLAIAAGLVALIYFIVRSPPESTF